MEGSGTVITFEEFMRRALYDPRTGYYTRRISAVGRRGDFTTVPVLTDALGRSVATWLARARRETGCRNVIEVGPGEGQLAQSVRGHLSWADRRRTSFHLVEVSAPLRAAQEALLGNSVRWHATVESALAACGGSACLYSNELVDAFPVRKFRREAQGWIESAVRPSAAGTLEEVWTPSGSLPDSALFSMEFPVGQIIEVHESYRAWLQDWLPAWKSGRMLTLDYGSTADMLYHRRPGGSLRGYWFQQVVQGAELLLREGHQDLTADVNFTDLLRWGGEWSRMQRLGTLREFCGGHAPDWLRDEGGAGDAFLVLEQWRG